MNIRSEARRFFVYGFGTISGSALNLLLIPLYLSSFTSAEYGVVNILLMFVTFSSLFVSAGMMSVMQKEYFAFENADRRTLVGTVVTWYVLVLALLSVVLLVFRRPVSNAFFDTEDYGLAVSLVPPLVLLTLLADVPLNLLRLEKRASAFVLVSVSRLLIDAGLKFVFIVRLDLGVAGYFLSTMSALVVTNAIGYTLVRGSVGLRFDRETFGRLVRLSSPFIITGFAVWSLQSVDRLMLNFLMSESATGVYSVGVRFGQVYNILFYTPLSALLPAIVFPAIADRDEERVRRIFARLTKGLVVVGPAIAFLIAVGSVGVVEFMDQIIDMDPSYMEARYTIPLLVGSHMTYSLLIPMGYTALHISRTGLLAASSFVAAVLNIALNALLIPSFGVVGAAVATATSYLAYGAVATTLLGRKLKNEAPLGRILAHLALFAVALFAGFRLQIGAGILIALLVGLVGMVLLLLSAWKVTRLVDPALLGAIRRRLTPGDGAGSTKQADA